MRAALAFIGGAAVAAIAFLLIETPSDRVAPPPPPAVPAAVAVEPPEAPTPPEPSVRPAARPAPAAPRVAVGPAAPPRPPAPVPGPPAPPAPAAAPAPANADLARLEAPPEQPGPPPSAPPPVAVKPDPPPLMKPDALEIRRAKEERTPETVTIPAGTVLRVRINQRLSSEVNESGDAFSATLEEPLIINGLVIAERGSRVDGRVADAVRAGRVKGVARLSIRLTTLHTSDGQRVAIFTEEHVREGRKSAGRDAARVAVGAGIGAAMGAIFGGGRGAAIGAATGGAAGTGSVLLTRGEAAELAVETRIPFRLREPVTITENLN